jgi:cell wall-associated NlpC family hydrolase
MADIGMYELMLRNCVVMIAQQVHSIGSHYLWGAQGDGWVPLVKPNVLGASEQDKCLNAASLNGSREYACAGRCNNAAVRGLAQWKGTTMEEFNRANGSSFLWPRYYRDADTANPSSSGLVYGESCQGKLHFDCAGFVRYCFRLILGAAMIPTNATMRSQSQPIWSVGQGGIQSADILPADLLYTSNYSHVGVATGSDSYNWWSFFPADYSFHAYYGKVGVLKTPILGGANDAPVWSHVYRWTKWG